METSRQERPVAKRLFVKETSKEDESVEAKRYRTGNFDSQNLESKVDEQIIQEKQRIIQDIKDLQAQIDKKLDRLKELTGSGLSSETKLLDEIWLKIFGYLSTYDVW